MQFSQTTTVSLCLSALITINEIVGNKEDSVTSSRMAESMVAPILDLTVLARDVYERSVTELEAAFQAGVILGASTSLPLEELTLIWEGVQSSVRAAFTISTMKGPMDINVISQAYGVAGTPVIIADTSDRFERVLPVLNMFKDMKSFEQTYVSPRAMLALLVNVAFYCEPN